MIVIKATIYITIVDEKIKLIFAFICKLLFAVHFYSVNLHKSNNSKSESTELFKWKQM